MMRFPFLDLIMGWAGFFGYEEWREEDIPPFDPSVETAFRKTLDYFNKNLEDQNGAQGN